MNSKLVYNYNEKGVFTGTGIAQVDFIDTEKFILPGNSTFIAPPDFSNETIPVWNGLNWTIEVDLRGKLAYNCITMQPTQITNVGVIPSTFTLIEPPKTNIYNTKMNFNNITQKWDIDIESQKEIDVKERDILLRESDAKIIRYTSEKALVDKGLINKTTNSEAEIDQWELYRVALRDYTNDYIANKPLPTTPNIA